jgi:hypothetical protein
MRKAFVPVLVVAFALAVSGIAMAANTATQTVTFQVDAISQLSVSGDPGALVISSATAGSDPSPATDNTTTYALTTNQSSQKIVGSIDSAMPSGVTLKVTLGAPTGGSSAGAVSLTASDQDLVTGISQVAESGKTIGYELDATVGAGVVSSDTRTVTFTLTAEVG